jgi:hypothetical protein
MKRSIDRLIACALAATLTLAGCATAPSSNGNYKQIVNSWMGSTEQKLESSWGMPTSSTPLANGGTMLEYVRNNTERTGWHGMATQGYICYTDFYVSALGQIYNWSYRSTNFGGSYECGDSL